MLILIGIFSVESEITGFFTKLLVREVVALVNPNWDALDKLDEFWTSSNWSPSKVPSTETDNLNPGAVPISKFPEVNRDLSILIDDELKFEKIHKSIKQINQKLIKEITLFDVYEGKNLPKNKKSYGISFKIQNDEKTLSDNEIEEIMNS